MKWLLLVNYYNQILTWIIVTILLSCWLESYKSYFVWAMLFLKNIFLTHIFLRGDKIIQNVYSLPKHDIPWHPLKLIPFLWILSRALVLPFKETKLIGVYSQHIDIPRYINSVYICYFFYHDHLSSIFSMPFGDVYPLVDLLAQFYKCLSSLFCSYIKISLFFPPSYFNLSTNFHIISFHFDYTQVTVYLICWVVLSSLVFVCLFVFFISYLSLFYFCLLCFIIYFPLLGRLSYLYRS